MRYQQPTFTLPTVNKPMTQTDYEIAVGLRNPDGSHVQPKKVQVSTTFKCGHERHFTSPGALDPAGALLEFPRARDGKVYATDIHPCHECQLTAKQMQVGK